MIWDIYKLIINKYILHFFGICHLFSANKGSYLTAVSMLCSLVSSVRDADEAANGLFCGVFMNLCITYSIKSDQS